MLTRRRVVPLSLGLAMLAVVVAAALAPNAGAVPAASNCTYGQCPSASSSIPTWELLSIGAVVVLGLLVGLFLVMRRRRRPPAEPAGAPMAPSGGPPMGAMEQAPPAGPSDEMGSASYVEGPDDVSAPPPALTPPPGPAPAAAGASAEAEPDIDSLMAELDKISGEILKRTPKKGSDAPANETDDDASS